MNSAPAPGPPRAYLTDFGLAKSVATGSKLTRTGQALGTPAYMSPEQARGEVSSLTPATDVWGLGCVLYEMLAGRQPFEAETSEGVVVGRILLTEPPRLRTRRGDVPAGLERVVRVTLAKRGQDRYRGSDALRDDLGRVLVGSRPRARLPGWRLRTGAGLAVAVAAGLGIAAAWPRELPPAPAVRAGPASSEADLLAARARGLRQADPREAARLLGQALSAAPERHDWRLERGLLLWAVGQWKAAREEWGSIPESATVGSRARLYRGLEALFRLEGGVFHAEEGRPDLEAAAAGRGEVAQIARGALATLSHDWSEARRRLRDAPGWEAALLRGYVEAGAEKGDEAAAVREYGRALEEGIPFAWVLASRGAVRHGLGDLRGALEDYDASLRLQPGTQAALCNRGLAKRDLRDPRGALADYDAALRIWPDDPVALNGRGAARALLGDLVGAIEDHGAALRLRPDFHDARSYRGAARQTLGDYRGAIEDYDAALALLPDFPEVHLNRGGVRWVLGDVPGALADYDAALRLRPGYDQALVARANARLDLGEDGPALEDFTAAVAAAPTPRLHGSRALALARLGRLDEALAAAATALSMDPKGPHYAYAARGLVRLRQGRRAEALAEFETFDSLAPRTDPLRTQVAGWRAEAAGDVPK
ncbi:MAG: tetratricopeptide repeat protein [Planctomycetales bacterium]|nr:tetratricopeptide repeat protein [Planctomycetales bacterium]